jgi:hypothetical protein
MKKTMKFIGLAAVSVMALAACGGEVQAQEDWTDGQKAVLTYFNVANKPDQNKLCAGWFYGERYKEYIHLDVYYFDKLKEQGLLTQSPSFEEIEEVLLLACGY